MQTQGEGGVTYVLDEEDRVLPHGAGWDAFAKENGAPELVRRSAMPLWDAIGEPTVRHLWQALVRRVRDDGVELTVPYRCDAPERRRWFEMRLSPGLGSSVHFQSSLLADEERPAILVEEAPSKGRGGLRPALTVCSWCKRSLAGGAWVELEDAVSQSGVPGETSPVSVVHGICPACHDLVEAILRPELA